MSPTEAKLRQAYARILSERARAGRSLCVLPRELLDLVEGRVSEDRLLELLDHVMGCGACLAEYELLQAISNGRSTTQ